MAAELTFQLADGERMPAVGFGTFEIKEEDAESVVAMALDSGYRHIDTAEGCDDSDDSNRSSSRHDSIRRPSSPC